MASNRIYIQVEFGTDAADQAVKSLNKNISGIGKAAEGASAQMQQGMKGISVSVEQASRSFDALAGAVTGLGIVQLGRSFAEATSQMIRAEITLKTLTGSVAEAKDMLAQVWDLSQNQPFKFSEILDTTVMLKAFGIEAKEVVGTLKIIADAAAGLGGTATKLQNISLAIGQMFAKGRVNAEEAFRQLGEAGVDVTKALQTALLEQTGKAFSSDEIRKMLEKNMLNARPAIQAILKGMASEFGNLGKEIVKQDPLAQFQKLLDELTKAAADLGKAWLPAVSKIIAALRDWLGVLKEIGEFLKTIPEPVQVLTISLIGMAAAASSAAYAFKGIAFAFKPAMEIAKRIPAVLGAASAVFRGIVGALFGEVTTLTTLFGTATVATNGFAASIAVLGNALLALTPYIIAVGAAYAVYRYQQEQSAQDPDVIAQVKEAFAEREKLVAKAQELQAKIQGAGIKFAMPERSWMSMQVDQLKQWTGMMETALKEYGDLLKANEDKVRHQREIALQGLQNAQQAMNKFFSDAAEKAGDYQRAIAYAFQEINAQRAGLVEETKSDPVARNMVRWVVLLDKARAAMDVLMKTAKNTKAELTMVWDSGLGQMVWLANTKQLTEEFKKQQEVLLETDEMWRRIRSDRQQYAVEEVEALKDVRMAELEAMPRQTVEQELAFIRHRTQVEIEEINKVRDARMQAAAAALQADLERVNVHMNLLTLEKMQLNDRRARGEAGLDPRLRQIESDFLVWQDQQKAITQATTDELTRIQIRGNREVITAEANARREMNEKILAEQRRVYDSLKDAAGRVFDALLQKSTSVWKAIANVFKVTMLTAIREIVTSRVAAALYRMMGYGDVQLGARNQPVFGGGGAGGAGGVGGLLGSILMPRGGPAPTSAVTPGYNPAPHQNPVFSPAPGAGTLFGGAPTAGAGGLGGVFSLGMWGAQLKGLKEIATKLGNLGSKTSGVHGAAGGAMLAGGATLAMMGLQRGGVSGLAMTTAGGALIGAKFGGPLGAAIGAAVGFTAGLIRLQFKSAEEKVRQKVQQVYGVNIQERNIRAQIVEIARQKYGGNLDVAVRSPEVQEIVKLYAMAVGQNPRMPRPMYGVTFEQSGAGGSQLQPVYANGQVVANPYTGMTSTQWASTPSQVFVQLDPALANKLFEGRVVNVLDQNPGAVADANATAVRAGVSRNEQRGAFLEPSTVLR